MEIAQSNIRDKRRPWKCSERSAVGAPNLGDKINAAYKSTGVERIQANNTAIRWRSGVKQAPLLSDACEESWRSQGGQQEQGCI